MPSHRPARPSRVRVTALARTFTATLALALALLAAVGLAVPAPAGADPATAARTASGATALQQWLAAPVVRIAHRGGSADWPEGSPLAYRRAAAWSPDVALEFPARRTADGVWVASEDATTGRVFGTDLTIAASTWAQLSSLRSTVGGQPLSRLKQTILDPMPRTRILFVDDKDDAHVDELLDLLDKYGGPARTVMKSFYQNLNTPPIARSRGYLTWGYYYERFMGDFAATQSKFDLLGIEYSASAATFRTMLATGKRVFAHVVATPSQADQGLASGATGLMVSGVREVVPRG